MRRMVQGDTSLTVGAMLGRSTMKRIPLTKGKEALVDNEVTTYLIQWKWHAAKGGNCRPYRSI